MDSSAADAEEAMTAALGPERAVTLIAELAALGMVAVDAAELERLRRESASYQRMARLVSPPTPSAADNDS